MRSLFQRSSGEPDRRSGENSRSSSVEIEQSPCLGLASSSDESQCSRFVGFLQLILKGAPRCVLPSAGIFPNRWLLRKFVCARRQPARWKLRSPPAQYVTRTFITLREHGAGRSQPSMAMKLLEEFARRAQALKGSIGVTRFWSRCFVHADRAETAIPADLRAARRRPIPWPVL